MAVSELGRGGGGGGRGRGRGEEVESRIGVSERMSGTMFIDGFMMGYPIVLFAGTVVAIQHCFTRLILRLWE